MKKKLLVFLTILLSVVMLTGCGQIVAENIPNPEKKERIYVVPDSSLAEDEYDPHIYGIDPNAPVVEIPEEDVPLASTYVDVTDGVSEREAEAIAIHHAGFSNNDVHFLHSRFVEEEPAYYHVEFRNGTVPYKFWISVEDGQILLYEKGN